MGEGVPLGKVVVIAIALIALVVVIVALFPLLKNVVDPFFSLIDDALGTKLSDQTNNLALSAELLKDQRVTLKWTVKKPEQIGYFRIYEGYRQSYKGKEEIDIDYSDNSNLISQINKGGPQDKNKKDFAWTTPKLEKPGWYKFTVYAVDTENEEALRKDVYVGFFDSTDKSGMALLSDEIFETRKKLLEATMSAFISRQPVISRDINLPSDSTKREEVVAGLTKEQVAGLFDRWFEEWVDSKDGLQNKREQGFYELYLAWIDGMKKFLAEAPKTFEAAGMIDVSKLK